MRALRARASCAPVKSDVRHHPMSVDPSDALARTMALKRARAVAFLDGVLVALFFNRSISGHTVPEIGLAEICDSLSPQEYDAARRRAAALLSKATALGAAYHGYPGYPSFAAALLAVKQAHPGFSEASYNSVVYDGALELR
jgi:hypothetical protein